MSKFQTILQRRVHPYTLLGACLVAIALVTALTGFWQHNYELAHSRQIGSQSFGANKQAHVTPTDETMAQPKSSSAAPAPITAKIVTHSSRPGSHPAAAGAASPSPTPAPSQPAQATVWLNINGIYRGVVSVSSADNQCDVLQTAYATGVISSLDMRYSAQYKTYAVYVIDGQGDSGSVWWTYSVNGKSPPYGCSGTKVKDGDSVDWKYVKQ